MVFDLMLKLMLGIFLLGTLHRVRGWFRTRIGPDAAALSGWQRLAEALRGVIPVLFGRRAFLLLRTLLLDVLLQARTLRRDLSRWVAHVCILYGLLLLLLMHALDRAVLVLLAAMVLSGFVLEAAKIVSGPVFHEMVDEYTPMADNGEVPALQAYWAARFGVVFPDPSALPADPQTLELGAEFHDNSCASCHDRPLAAFVSFPLARALAPAAPFLNRIRADRWLLPVHYLACLIALALLPFTKFLHLAATPAALLARTALDPATVRPGNLATRRALALDACTPCGDCTLHCSVAPVYRRIPNPDILASEKLLSIREAARGRDVPRGAMRALAEGASICTLCYRCTTICPSGIYLQDLWTAASADLVQQGFPDPHVRVRAAGTWEWAERIQYHPDAFPLHRNPAQPDRDLADRSETFEACIQCQTCTNMCPVVAWSPDRAGDVGITPQQIMNLLRIGLKELTLGSPMVWDCVTCYMCQEHCPEGIRVTDILYELRNLAYEKFRAIPNEDEADTGPPLTGGGRHP